MRAIIKRIVIVGGVAAMFLLDVYVVSEAEAVFGTRRRTAMMTAAVVKSSDEQKAQQPAQTTEQAAPAPAATPAPSGSGALAIGTIVDTLPPNCPETTEKGVAYYKCGGNYYRAAFQGSTLVYVTAQP